MQQTPHKNQQKRDDNILTQNNLLSQSKQSRPRKLKLGWILVALCLPLFGIVAAFGTSSPNDAKQIYQKTTVEEIDLPLVVRAAAEDETFWQIDSVRRDDTLGSLFKRMGLRDDDAVKFLMLSPDAHALNTQLIPGHRVEIKSNPEGRLLHLEYEVDNEDILVATLTEQGFKVATQKLILKNTQILKSATIVNSLFGATDDAGIPDQIALQIADIFSGEIDFNEDLRPGDKFNVIYEAFYNAGELMKTGNILAVEFVNDGEVYRAIHFGDAEGKFAYYSPEGKSLHKSFLRSPVEFTRVSSGFSTGRFHPILNRMRAHQGVDLAAPMGTRIKAAGDGVVEFMGKKGGYGNAIMLKHENGVSTVYGHLSRFESGLHKGQEVAQGDFIGYVGMTGLATGPHLHYEFLVAGVHRDPLTVALPISIPIDGKFKQPFDNLSHDLMAKIAMLNNTKTATKD
jgi:murein DD-endopeptidase MepM/ murein hydrolase activator NlpD